MTFHRLSFTSKRPILQAKLLFKAQLCVCVCLHAMCVCVDVRVYVYVFVYLFCERTIQYVSLLFFLFFACFLSLSLILSFFFFLVHFLPFPMYKRFLSALYPCARL